jgi:hypothetical protein
LENVAGIDVARGRVPGCPEKRAGDDPVAPAPPGLDQRRSRSPRPVGEDRRARIEIDRRADERQAPHFRGVPGRGHQAQPTTLAKPEKIHVAAKIVDGEREVGHEIVDPP